MRQPAPRTGCSRRARGRGLARGGAAVQPGPHVSVGRDSPGPARPGSPGAGGRTDPLHSGICCLYRRAAPAGRCAAFLTHALSSAFQDLVKSHLMYAVREEVEVLKEQIKELIEKNSQLEQENTLLKTLASPEQLAQFQAQLQTGSPPSSSQSQGTTQQPAQPASQGSGPSA